MDNLKQNIRKWNHDILTHMIGITYLMDMQRYPEAERYCEKILNSLSSFSETFRTRATSPDPDSVSESPVPTDYLPEGFIEYQEKLPAEITAFQTLLQQKNTQRHITNFIFLLQNLTTGGLSPHLQMILLKIS